MTMEKSQKSKIIIAKQGQRRPLCSAVRSLEHQEFIDTVNNVMEVLIVRHGYSRERATKALLQEISRSMGPPTGPSTVTATDDQVRH